MDARVTRPAADESSPYYFRYIDLVPDGDIVGALQRQADLLPQLFQTMPETQAALSPTAGAWSAKQVLLHVTDAERLFAFRAMWFARGETAPLPGMEPDPWIAATDANARTVADLLAEFGHVRAASVALFTHLDAAGWARRGTASSAVVSVRALAWTIAGHELHHLRSLREEYL